MLTIFQLADTPISIVTSNNDEFTLEKIGDQFYIRRQGFGRSRAVKYLVLYPCRSILSYSLGALTSMYIENQGLVRFDIQGDLFPNLEVASFAFNRIRTVPKFLYGLQKIQNIYLNNNKIKYFKVQKGAMLKG